MTTEKSLPILIVEDDQPTQLLLRTVLRRCGFASEIASNGRQAITMLEGGTFAAVILDMMMPEVFGRDVIDFLAARPEPTPVVVCSAAGPAALTGFDPRIVKAVVRKPFDIETLQDAVTLATTTEP